MATVKFKFKVETKNFATVPKLKDFVDYYQPPCKKEAKKIKQLYYQDLIIKKFKTARRPRIKVVAYRNGPVLSGSEKGIDSASFAVGAAAGTDNDKTPFSYLDGGTEIRKRAVSANYMNKTHPGTLNWSKGRGRALNKWGRYPGIKARNWREKIVELRIKSGQWETSIYKAHEKMLKDLKLIY